MINAIGKENNLISIKDLANQLKTSEDTIKNCIKRIMPNKMRNGIKTLLNETETSFIINELKNNQKVVEQLTYEAGSQLEQTKTELMIKEEFQHQIAQAKALPRQEKLTLALSTFQSLLEDLQKDNKQKQATIDELQNWKTEKLYIENEQYKSKELKTKINRLIRQIAIERFNKDFKGTWNYYLNLYCNIHCFKGGQTIEMITDRGDLKEFYNLILNY